MNVRASGQNSGGIALACSSDAEHLARVFDALSAARLLARVVVLLVPIERADLLAIGVSRDVRTCALTWHEGSLERRSDEVHAAVVEHLAATLLLIRYLRRLCIPPDAPYNAANVHGSLLPELGGRGMYGRHIHEAAIAGGLAHSGCTLHRLTHDYDRGEILQQHSLRILPEWTADELRQHIDQVEVQMIVDYVALFPLLEDENRYH